MQFIFHLYVIVIILKTLKAMLALCLIDYHGMKACSRTEVCYHEFWTSALGDVRIQLNGLAILLRQKKNRRKPRDISLIKITGKLTELSAGEERICKNYLALVSPPQNKTESVRLLRSEQEAFCADFVELRSTLSIVNAESDESFCSASDTCRKD